MRLNHYNPKMNAVLRKLGATLRKEGFKVSAPFDVTDEEYRFDILVQPPKTETIRKTCGSCGAELRASTSFPWHKPDDDCRAIREPLTSLRTDRVDISLTLTESIVREGQPEEGEPGFSFRFDIVAEGGQTLGVIAIGNYSDLCWVPKDELEARWQDTLDTINPDQVVEILKKFYSKAN